MKFSDVCGSLVVDYVHYHVMAEVKRLIDALKIGRWTDRVWWLLISAALLGVMARGFKWI
jgi:hypothetical protein